MVRRAIGGGISEVVEDTSPQLGGDLDMNTNNITADGPTTISPTEMSYLDGVTSNLQTQIDAKGTGTLSNVVEDTTPQLGGDLDAQSNSVTGLGGITAAATGMTITSATNGNITVDPGGSGVATLNAGTGGVTISTDAGNSNIALSPHGTGTVDIAASKALSFNGTDILTDSAGTMTLSNVDALDATTEATIESAIDTLANLTSVQGNTVTLTGDLIRSGAHSLTLTTTAATNVTLPTTGTLITADGTKTLTNTTFDANGTGNSLSNVDVADLANGTDGELITWSAAGAPTTVGAGTANQVLTSNGAGAAPTFQDAAGGGALQTLAWAGTMNCAGKDCEMQPWADPSTATVNAGQLRNVAIWAVKAGTINDIIVHTASDLSSSNGALDIRINGTVDTTLTLASGSNAADTFTSQAISVSQGDYVTVGIASSSSSTNWQETHVNMVIE